MHEQSSLRLSIGELPTAALELTYNEFMKDYESNPKEEIQQKLILISKILNDRAYQQGNGKLKNRLQEKFPDITDEQFKTMSKDEKEQLEKSLDAYDKLSNIAKKISQPQPTEPETIEFEMKVETPTTIKEPSEHVSIASEEEEFEPPKPRVIKKKKKGFLSKLIKVPKEEPSIEELNEAQAKANQIIVEENKKIEIEKSKIEIEKSKPTKPRFAFLKKKKLKKAPLSVVADQVSKATAETIQERPVTPEQKERAKTMQAATVKKLLQNPIFKKKVDTGEPKLDLKKLDEVYCNICKHSIKQHQKGGKSSGCNKCGCLSTIEEIAEQKGVALYAPRVVLDKIEQENLNVEELMKQTQPKQEPKPTKEELDKKEEGDYIKKQAAKIASMSKTPQQPPQKAAPEPKKIETYQCTCDHQLKDHFNNVEFCTVVGCQCKEFREYPKQ